MTRRHWSRKARAEIFEAAGGLCHICGGKISVGQAWHLEHRLQLAMGGADEAHNLAPAHVKCHREKTSAEAPILAKAKRLEAKHNGTWPKTRTPLRSRGFQKSRPVEAIEC